MQFNCVVAAKVLQLNLAAETQNEEDSYDTAHLHKQIAITLDLYSQLDHVVFFKVNTDINQRIFEKLPNFKKIFLKNCTITKERFQEYENYVVRHVDFLLKLDLIIDVDDHDAMDTQEINTQDIESSFDIEDGTVSQIDDNSNEFNNSVSQHLVEKEEHIDSGSNECNDDEMSFNNLTSSRGKNRENNTHIQPNQNQNDDDNPEESQKYINLQSDKYSDSDKELKEQNFDNLTSSLCQKRGSANEDIGKVPSNLSENLLPSISDIMKKIDIEPNRFQSEIIPRSVLNSSQIRKESSNEAGLNSEPKNDTNDNREYKSVNALAEITDVVKKNQAKTIVFETQKSGDLQSDENTDSKEQDFDKLTSNLSKKRKSIISKTFRTSKKFKLQANENAQKANKSTQKANKSTIINVPSDLPYVFEVFVDNYYTEQSPHTINGDIPENEIIAESDHDDISSNNGKSRSCGSTTISKCHKKPSYYAEKLKNLRKKNKKTEIFESNPGVQDEMYSKPIETYFTEDTAPTFFEPLPKPRMEIANCLKFFYQWDQNFEQCEKEIINQHYKMLKLIYSLSEVFFTLLIFCYQEQQHEVSQKTLDKSMENWKACWRLHHFLWVTNVTPTEMIEVKLNANYFFETTKEDYNLLIKELLKNSEFTEFRNPKGAKVLEIVNIANNIYAI
ncbi:6558_t:CDS:10 [Gigaspora margarita]|uniref:6558_t:CDS:1 n=1 Tax=Gigaspora margarita TaxID=4874 RepID=A0ABM8VYL6_GIGMA|nr:6558_t:CDS:10 [Gigaspora margarita]